MEQRSDEYLAYVWATQRLASAQVDLHTEMEVLRHTTQDALWNRFAIAASSMETACALLSASIEAVKAINTATDGRELATWLLRANDSRSTCLDLHRQLATHIGPKIRKAQEGTPDEGSEA